MQRLLFLVGLVAFFSCQKAIESDPDPNTNPTSIDSLDPGSGAILLVKSVARFGNDSTVTDFLYNDASQLKEMFVTRAYTLNGQSKIEKTFNGFEWDDKKRLSQIKIKYQQKTEGRLWDTIRISIYYPPGESKQYTHSIVYVKNDVEESSDSVTYQYNAGGQISKMWYYSSDKHPYVYRDSADYYVNFSWDLKGNITKWEQHSAFLPPPLQSYDIDYVTDYSHDDKLNPLRNMFGGFLSDVSWVNSNNVTNYNSRIYSGETWGSPYACEYNSEGYIVRWGAISYYYSR
jgi:hypothetical protein